VRRQLTAAQLWPDTISADRTTAGKRKTKAASTTDDEFEAEFQLFEEEDNDDETPIEAVSAAGRSRRNCPFLAGATSPGGAA
jgi:hypothetical protein